MTADTFAVQRQLVRLELVERLLRFEDDQLAEGLPACLCTDGGLADVGVNDQAATLVDLTAAIAAARRLGRPYQRWGTRRSRTTCRGIPAGSCQRFIMSCSIVCALLCRASFLVSVFRRGVAANKQAERDRQD
jgi:hypothetical protein